MQKGLKKTIIISGILGGLTVFSYLIYRQVLKVIKFTIKPKSIKSLGVNNRMLNLIVTMGVNNPSEMKFILKEQEYDVYINDVFITRLENKDSQIIYPMATSNLSLNLNVNLNELISKLDYISGVSFADKLNIIANLKNQRLKLVSKLSIKYGVLPSIPIETEYENTFKNWGL